MNTRALLIVRRSLLVIALVAVVASSTVTESPALASAPYDTLIVDPLLQVPTNVCGSSQNGSVHLTWDPVTDVNVTAVAIQYQAVSASTWTDAPSVASSATSNDIAGSNGAPIRFRVANLSATGRSDWGHPCLLGWGSNVYGQLVNGPATDPAVPVGITGGALAGRVVTSVAAGHNFACATTSDGAVVCWGSPSSFFNAKNPPIVISGGALTGHLAVTVTAGASHACALLDDHSIACWGSNTSGQLGDGDFTTSATPVAVTGGAMSGRTAVAMEAGGDDTCAITDLSQVVCWGYNGSGQLGDPSLLPSNLPVAVASGSLTGVTVTQVTVGVSSVCALSSVGRVSCWGGNDRGQLGSPTGTVGSTTSPTEVRRGALAQHVVSSLIGSDVPVCAVVDDGRLACWGGSWNTNFGTAQVLNNDLPTFVDTGSLAGRHIVHVGLRWRDGCATDDLGRISCWDWSQQTSGPTVLNSGAMFGASVTSFAESGSGEAYFGPWNFTMSPGSPPTAPTQVGSWISGGSSVTVQWTQSVDAGSTPISSYQIESSKDEGLTWSAPVTAAVGSLGSMSVPTFGYWWFRVRAVNAAGLSDWSAPSTDLTISPSSTAPITPGRVRFVTRSGVPIVGASVSPSTNGVLSGTTDSKGEMAANVWSGFSGYALQNGTVAGTHVVLEYLDTTAALYGPGPAIIRVPDPPAVVARQVTVRMPNGRPVPDVSIQVNGALTKFDPPLTVMSPIIWSTTDWPAVFTSGPTGTLTIRGFQVPSVGNDVTATLTGALADSGSQTLVDPVATITIGAHPWLEMVSAAGAALDPGRGRQIKVVAHDAAGNAVSGVSLHLASVAVGSTAPAGSHAATSACTPALTATTGVGGVATFTVCPTSSGNWRATATGYVSSQPVLVPVAVAPTQLSAGSAHTCARLADGTARCWGAGAFGRLGNGGVVDALAPVAVSGLTKVSQVAAGDVFSCATISAGPSGQVRCWGANSNGQLGNGLLTSSATPVVVTATGATPLSGVSSVATGTGFACAVLTAGTSGTVRCWGANSFGQLGDGTTTRRTRPVKVLAAGSAGLTGVTAVATGAGSACALLSTGSVRCWGLGTSGQLGNGATISSTRPVQVSGIDGVKAKATAISVGNGFACARINNGTVRCWGANTAGQLGNGLSARSAVPVQVHVSATAALSGVATLDAGDSSVCVTTGSGATAVARCWGSNAHGQLGDGSLTTRRYAVPVGGPKGVSVVSVGGSHTVALVASVVRPPTSAVAWGANASGQLGDGTRSQRLRPVSVPKL